MKKKFTGKENKEILNHLSINKYIKHREEFIEKMVKYEVLQKSNKSYEYFIKDLDKYFIGTTVLVKLIKNNYSYNEAIKKFIIKDIFSTQSEENKLIRYFLNESKGLSKVLKQDFNTATSKTSKTIDFSKEDGNNALQLSDYEAAFSVAIKENNDQIAKFITHIVEDDLFECFNTIFEALNNDKSNIKPDIIRLMVNKKLSELSKLAAPSSSTEGNNFSINNNNTLFIKCFKAPTYAILHYYFLLPIKNDFDKYYEYSKSHNIDYNEYKPFLDTITYIEKETIIDLFKSELYGHTLLNKIIFHGNEQMTKDVLAVLKGHKIQLSYLLVADKPNFLDIVFRQKENHVIANLLLKYTKENNDLNNLLKVKSEVYIGKYLHAAASLSDVEMMAILFQKLKEFNNKNNKFKLLDFLDPYGGTILHTALKGIALKNKGKESISKEDNEIAIIILNFVQEQEFNEGYTKFLEQKGSGWGPALHAAADYKNANIVIGLLAGLRTKKITLSSHLNKNGATALHVALRQEGDFAIVNLLLKHAEEDNDLNNLLKVISNSAADWYGTPLHTAAYCGNIKMMKILFDKLKEFNNGKNENDKLKLSDFLNNNGGTILHVALKGRSLRNKSKKSILEKENKIATLILDAVKKQESDKDYKAFLQQQGSGWGPALHTAADYNDVLTVKKILNELKDARIDCTKLVNKNGATALHVALEAESYDAAEALLNHVKEFKDADSLDKFIDCINKAGKTAIQVAKCSAKSDTILSRYRTEILDATMNVSDSSNSIDSNDIVICPQNTSQNLTQTASSSSTEVNKDRYLTEWLTDHIIRSIVKAYSEEGMFSVHTYDNDYEDSTNGLVVVRAVDIGYKSLGISNEFDGQLKEFISKNKERVRARRTFIINVGGQDSYDLKKKDNLVISGTHWVTLVVDYHKDREDEYRVYYVDSLAVHIEAEERENIHKVLRESLNSIRPKSVIHEKQQKDGYNCGFWAIQNAFNINTILNNNDAANALNQDNDLSLVLHKFINIDNQFILHDIGSPDHFTEQRKIFKDSIEQEMNSPYLGASELQPSGSKNTDYINKENKNFDFRTAPLKDNIVRHIIHEFDKDKIFSVDVYDSDYKILNDNEAANINSGNDLLEAIIKLRDSFKSKYCLYDLHNPKAFIDTRLTYRDTFKCIEEPQYEDMNIRRKRNADMCQSRKDNSEHYDNSNDDPLESDLNRYDAVIGSRETSENVAPILRQSISSFNPEDKFNNFSMGVHTCATPNDLTITFPLSKRLNRWSY